MQDHDSRVELQLRVNLPQPLASEAKASGLLTADSIEAMLRGELRRRRVDDLFHAADLLADLPMPPLTAEEVEHEIATARRQRRSSDARPPRRALALLRGTG